MFGLLVLPAKYYPWVLLVVWQLLMPGVSFLVGLAAHCYLCKGYHQDNPAMTVRCMT